VLGYLDDLHADFWAIWGIDIHRDTTLTGPEFFAMARRTFSYDGLMAARARAEEQAQQRTPTSAPTQPAQPAAQGEQAHVVDLATFRAMHPGVIGHSSDNA
jgi:hypothetical protein